MGEHEQYHPRQTQGRICALFAAGKLTAREAADATLELWGAKQNPPTRREKAVMWALFALVLVGCALYLWQAKGGPA